MISFLPGRSSTATRSRTDYYPLPRNEILLAALEQAAPGAVAARATDRLGFAHDASHYLLVPQAIVSPRSAAELAALLRVSAECRVPLTFRSGGTSLSGQATTDGVLVDTRRHFRDIEVLDDGARVRVQPGATVRAVNTRLARYGRKLGPDPASESACTIGGVVANNSSGMACGTELNTYATLDSAILVLPSGTVLDTGAADADERLRALEPVVYEGLARLRDRVCGNAHSLEVIRKLYSIKNTMGYGVNSFVDHSRPIDILAHLIIGSEGTLAFVAEATFRTVPSHAHAATGLLLFPDLAAATGSLPDLVDAGFDVVELLDSSSLRVAQDDPRAVSELRALEVAGHAALLVEHQQPDTEHLRDRVAASAQLLAGLPLSSAATLSTDPSTRTALWHIRKGLYATVAGARPSGTTALLEDIAVPVGALLGTCDELTTLFERHGYGGSVIFGHAKNGNIHFMISEDFERSEAVDRYLRFTADMVDLVLAADGTLKAEHGTGRIMAPFVRRQYGDELYEVMCEVKQLLDPRALLNPGIVLDEDPVAHVRNLKSAPTVETEVDRCVECGYCEPVCPSRDLTTTPRRRIVLRREIARAAAAGDEALRSVLEDEYDYDAVATCAVDGMCRTACPVMIDTGELTRRLRAERTGRVELRLWRTAAQHWDGATRIAGAALTAAHAVPAALPVTATRAARAVLGERVPAWSAELPGGGTRRTPRREATSEAVYFPACLSTIFGGTGPGPGVRDSVLSLCDRAGVAIRVPDGIASLCCGTPWKSKGLAGGYDAMRAQVVPVLRTATDEGAVPVVVDAASCTEGLRLLLADEHIEVVDAVAFTDSVLLQRLPPPRPVPTLVVHPTCSSAHLGLGPAVMRIAAALADEVVVPDDVSCCGFAGDRGLLFPELTASATAAEAREVAGMADATFVSVNRTCELGMTRATGHTYHHLLDVLDQRTRSVPDNPKGAQ